MKSFKQTLEEDIQPGYAPEEISFGGYTTKNLHHSADATKAFASTIDKVNRGEIKDKESVLHALKATDAYMKINDMHLEQGKAPDEAELEQWRNAHVEARNHLNKIGEFMHHMDYWHNHEHEIQDMETNYTPATAGAEMADSYDPQGDQLDEATRFATAMKSAIAAHERGDHKRAKYHLDTAKTARLSLKSTEYGKHKDLLDKYKEMSALHEELTDKTIKASDRVKVARMIADMLGVENAESLSPDSAVNQGLRKIKSKRMTPEFVGTVKKMVQLATEVGIKVDTNLLPKAVSEAKDDTVVDTDSTYNAAKGILSYKDFEKLSKVNKGIVPESEDALENKSTKVGHSLHHTDDDHIRRMKVKYKTEDIDTADYKINPETGRKSRAHKIEFANSGAKGKLDHVDEQSDAGTEDKMDQQVKKAGLALRHTKERQAMADRHDKQKSAVTEEADFDVLDLSDDELDALANNVSFDDLVDVTDEEDLMIIDPETGEEIEDEDPVNEEALMEVLSRSERMKAKIRFMRTQPKRERRMEISLKRRADSKTINKRSRRLAINLIKQRLFKKPASQMTVSEKERAERMIQQRRALVDRLAMRLSPKVRRMESDRLAGHKSTAK